ncbi:DUF2177 family protein [Candidatus Gracilibacteria bacterium]|nr:DUF2177 family protein [Candidatus Gracilibacteria bacterium]
MEILKLFLTFGVGYLVILIGDAIFLGRVVHQFIIDNFGSLITSQNGSIDMKLWAGLIAWFFIVAMIFIFVIKSGLVTNYSSALLYGAIMGFLMYGMYDFTNLTFMKDYPINFVIVDVIWGTFLCAMIALAMYSFQTWIDKVL